MRLECKHSIAWNCKNLFELQLALKEENARMHGHNFVTYRVRDIGFFTMILTKDVDLPYRTGLISSVIEKYAENENEKKVKFALVKRNVYFGNKRRVGAYCMVIQFDEKDSAHLQRFLIRAQRDKGFSNTMKYSPFGFVGAIGQENYVNILRQQNEFMDNNKSLALYKLDKANLKKILSKKKNGRCLLNWLHDENIITGVESVIEEEDKVFFMEPEMETIKQGLREHVLSELIYGGNEEVHMGRHQYDDVPKEDIAALVTEKEKNFK